MGVYIKGMEMPPNCSRCPMLEGDRMDGLCHAASRWLDDDEFWTWYVYTEGDVDDSKPCNCPLVPVPLHGRLIDADEFLKRAIGTKCFRGDYALMLEELVGESTTIIEAEEGET